MFGRRKREETAAAAVVREAERGALFARLAERPDNVCPFLGLDGDRAGYVEGANADHRCFAFGDPITLSAEQQTRVCQERGYGNCPRYLRGVLVIPTEELEALRRKPLADELASPPIAAATAGGARRPPLAIIAGGVLLVAVVAVVAFVLLSGNPGVATASPTPTVGVTASPTTEATTVPTPPPVAWEWVDCQPTLPCASEQVSRGQMASFLSHAFELAPVTDRDYFDDIGDSPYRGEINAVAAANLTYGCSPTTFCPDGLVTREQMATFIQRAFNIPRTDQTFFSDVDASIHRAAINALAAADVATGCGGTKFCPLDIVDREELAGYLHRALNR